MKSQLEIDVDSLKLEVKGIILDQECLDHKVDGLRCSLFKMRDNVIAIQKALELMARSVSLAKQELQEKHANSNPEVPK